MIWHGNGKVEVEEGEPAMRSCWECNSAHERLKTVNFLHVCFDCGRYWVFDRFLNSFDSDEMFDAFFQGLGMGPGQSTTTIDKGYRISVITVQTTTGDSNEQGTQGV